MHIRISQERSDGSLLQASTGFHLRLTERSKTMSPVEAADQAEAPKVILGKYELGKLLGRGSSAKVYHARDLSTGRGVAIKCIAKHKLLDDKERGGGGGIDVLREVSSMRRVRHPNVIRLHEVLASRGNVYLVMEHARGGELLQRLASRGRLPEHLARRYFRQLVSAVGYCHSRGVFHRDLKLENLLLSDAGHDGGLLKVSDFGLSAVSDSGAAVFRTLCGTPAYVAPEILAKKAYDAAKVDVWSCGVILYILVTGYLPFNDLNLMRMYRKIYRGEYRCPKWVSPQLRRLLARLLDANPDRRADVRGILDDPWFRAGLDEREREKLGRFRHFEDGEWIKVEEVGESEINAFDIISMSSGCDLSGLFGEATRRDAFAADAGEAEGVLEEVEEVARREGMEVVRRGLGLGLVVAKGGNWFGRVAVHRLDPGLVMVESGWIGSEGWEWFREMKMRKGFAG